MKKKVHIKYWKELSGKYDITIYKNKIIKYDGFHPIDDANRFRENSVVELNNKFEINKIDKIDRNEFKLNASHEIHCERLREILQRECYVQLNMFQSIYISWCQKKFLIQSLDVKKSLLTGFIGLILGACLTYAIQCNGEIDIDDKNESTATPVQNIKKHENSNESNSDKTHLIKDTVCNEIDSLKMKKTN
jgi:hypothetical protein